MHQGLDGDTPEEKADSPSPEPIGLEDYAWQSHCHDLFDLPIAA
ncbi:MAG TPA: hypothetical protein P5186_25725 [Candidatus Paceibacterota bacterium]|nr:hypothetical protein [Verrucomicrobiota bacterium]HRY51459.1 hypothetical protein [Candidatus Paceibacterota bacterium]HSA03921.1 hypothetical protein [Candidatus Paceibacterota bacterium]